MKAKDIKRGLAVAIGTHPGDQWARRAIVIDSDRMWQDISDRWARKPRYHKSQRTSLSKYAVAVEQPDHDERETRKTETADRLAWHRDVAARAQALGVQVCGQWTSREVTVSGADVDRLLELAEAGAKGHVEQLTATHIRKEN